MIVLWILSMLIVLTFTLVLVFIEVREEQGLIKWIVIALFLLVLITLVMMGIRIWVRN